MNIYYINKTITVEALVKAENEIEARELADCIVATMENEEGGTMLEGNYCSAEETPVIEFSASCVPDRDIHVELYKGSDNNVKQS